MLMKVHHAATVLFLSVCFLGVCVPIGAARAEATKTTQDDFMAICEKVTEASAPGFPLSERKAYCVCKFGKLASSLSNREIITLISSYKKDEVINLPERIYDVDDKISQECFKSQQ